MKTLEFVKEKEVFGLTFKVYVSLYLFNKVVTCVQLDGDEILQVHSKFTGINALDEHLNIIYEEISHIAEYKNGWINVAELLDENGFNRCN